MPKLGFVGDVADASDDVGGERSVAIDGDDADGDGGVVGPEDEVSPIEFDVADGAVAVEVDGVHVLLASAIRLESGVVAIDEESGAGQCARRHGHPFSGVGFDKDKSAPIAARGIGVGAQALEKSFLEFEDIADLLLLNVGGAGGDGGIDEEDVIKVGVGGREDGGAFVDLVGIKEIEDGEFENGEETVESFE